MSQNTADEEQPLGSASTLSRLENRITEKELADLKPESREAMQILRDWIPAYAGMTKNGVSEQV